MHIPKNFQVTDRDTALEFIRANAFGQLISEADGQLFATHMPFLLEDGESQLVGHIARANPHWQPLGETPVLIIFQGAHGYVSPSWYHAPGVPTWNYQSAHVYGTARHFTETERLREIVERLSNEYESGFAEPWQPNYDDRQLRGIVGIEIDIEEIQCKFKLSQNRSKVDQLDVAKRLRALGNIELANAMDAVTDQAHKD